MFENNKDRHMSYKLWEKIDIHTMTYCFSTNKGNSTILTESTSPDISRQKPSVIFTTQITWQLM